ncbi:MAG TPA: hypothetical protein VGE69_15370 [Pseudomonadales bacterium]
MTYNLLKNALLAMLLHAGTSCVIHAGNEAPAIASGQLLQSCAMPNAVLTPKLAGAHS